MEVAMEEEHVGISEVLLDLNFAMDLLFNASLDDLRLVETLEREDGIGLTLCANHVDLTKITLA